MYLPFRVNQIVFFSIIFCWGLFSLHSQTIDTTVLLKEVNISANRINNFSSGTKINFIDSMALTQYNNHNLSDLLTDESSLFIKSYGTGTLATSSFRGGSANHTAVLWNGFNINSPMNGQLDLSLVPVSFSDAISVQHGGTSALWGSGAVGGVIHLNNVPEFNKGLITKINLSGGSFKDFNQQISLKWSKKRFISSIRIFNSKAKNDFEYTNIYSPEKVNVTQTNAEIKNYGLSSENFLLLKENQKLNLFFWYQFTDRNIPPTMLQLTSKSNQKDNIYRITSEWMYERRKALTYIRAAYFDESLIFSDGIYFYSSANRSQSIITESETKINLHTRHLINIGINNTFVSAIAPGYSHKPEQNRTALFSSYLFSSKNEKFHTNVSFRQETSENKFVPFTYSIGSDYHLIKWLSMKMNFSKVYRIPTFNDLYWNPGGNPDLLPESGFSEETGLKLNLENQKIALKSDVTVFSRKMENWIIWLPGISYWSPQNIMNVWSRGMETNSMLAVKFNKAKISFSVLTNYVVSTNQRAKSANDASVDKQLIYVPMYSGHAKISIEYKGFVMAYRHNYTGYRYTTTDNTQSLPPFYLGSFYLSYKMKLNNSTGNIFFQANNVWNEPYQVILNRAMPQQNFNSGISFEFNKPNNHN